ncbi:triphosphoribosyl-dephospho-CoA synthase [Pediococcus siamensis]|uniref:triphosphoribosyl-dephospho-CoA synthase n=1 Tax=Pediococcus siamensis TaxID=381829 RepID=UPI0039A229E0
MIKQRVSLAEQLAEQAVAALKWEANFSPKPGLVTRNSNGAHTDMNIDLFMRSADSLYETFVKIAQAAEAQTVSVPLREEIGAIGRDGERAMLRATNGINTHKGAIWALGLLVAASSLQSVPVSQSILKTAGEIAQLPDRYVVNHPSQTYGQQAKEKYQVTGAREEAAAGFPNVARSLQGLATTPPHTNAQWLKILCDLYAHVDDTNVIHRSSIAVLRAFQKTASKAAQAVDIAKSPAFQKLVAMTMRYHISPGGCADLFAATYFLDNLKINEED